MPKRTDIHSVLIIGAGPIIIGQACEFDYSGTQACKALKEEGYRVKLQKWDFRLGTNFVLQMHDGAQAERTQYAHGKSHLLRRVALIEVNAALHYQHRDSAQKSGHDTAQVALDSGLGKVWNLGIRNDNGIGDGIGHRAHQPAPPAAIDHPDPAPGQGAANLPGERNVTIVRRAGRSAIDRDPLQARSSTISRAVALALPTTPGMPAPGWVPAPTR